MFTQRAAKSRGDVRSDVVTENTNVSATAAHGSDLIRPHLEIKQRSSESMPKSEEDVKPEVNAAVEGEESKMPKRKRENESLEEYRKRNALYSRRSYYRRREKFRQLETDAMLLKEQNYGLQKERVRLEGLMAQAQLIFRTYSGGGPPPPPPGGAGQPSPPGHPAMFPPGYFPFMGMNPQVMAAMQQSPGMPGMMPPGPVGGEEGKADDDKDEGAESKEDEDEK